MRVSCCCLARHGVLVFEALFAANCVDRQAFRSTDCALLADGYRCIPHCSQTRESLRHLTLEAQSEATPLGRKAAAMRTRALEKQQMMQGVSGWCIG